MFISYELIEPTASGRLYFLGATRGKRKIKIMEIRSEKEETEGKWLSSLGVPHSFLTAPPLTPHAYFRTTVV